MIEIIMQERLEKDKLGKDTPEKQKSKIIKADQSLGRRVGFGPLDKRVVESCQKAMERSANTQDFSEIAKEFLNELEQGIINARENTNGGMTIQNMVSPVMQLKGSAKIFGYELVGNLANVMLSFLETIKELDNTAIEIVDAHHKTLSAIILKKMSGDGGVHGEKLETELIGACKRYQSKKNPNL